ncbi:DUF11 domain-containing protein [Marivirga sp. S37H4]|uniref:DUF11 domain-containing protein n=1 Tax=Marivirga aurantiaca TaxID=2802615 RepID=A0A934X0F3_9BACT|nr:T9SS type A sorting domain-containing protein [Marivirga aurantiaca]MBK6266182.1 DUF11 domain-containing protein [Marivirga aurantiaca]
MKSLFTVSSIIKSVAIAITLLFNLSEVRSQNATDYIFNAEIRNYVPITGGTVISNNQNHDNQFFNNRNIGFDFNYFGTDHTTIGVSINGFASFSNGDGTTYPLFNGLDNSISPLSGDLRAQAGSELRAQTTGNAPNRVFTIQWSNYRWNGKDGSYNFQLKLYESSNLIEFHYGNFTHTGTQSVSQVSINRNNTDFQSRVGANTNWDTNNTVNTNDRGIGIVINNGVVPTNGLVFAFAPPSADLSINIAANTGNPCVGQEILYEISLTNNGPATTENISVNFDLPAGLTFVEANAEEGNYNSGTGNWTINNLSNGENLILIIKATVNVDQSGNSLLANAEIVSSSMFDNNSANDASDITVSVGTNTIPEISAITDQSVGYNQVSSPIDFTISDAETAVDDLIITITSSNTTVLPLSGLDLTGTGNDRTLTITPGLNQFGVSDISIEVSDGTCAKTISFNVEVFKQSYSNFESAKIVVGQVDFNTVSTTASQVTAPGSNSSAVSAKGVLAVGSQTTNRVLIWNSVPTADGTPANIVVGQTNFTNTGAANTASRLRAPDGVTFSPDGNKLIVADAGNNRILIWNAIPTSNNQAADVVIGQTNFTNNGTGRTASRFNRPTDVQITPSGKMIVTDRNNNRVLIFNKIPTTNNAAADVVIGQTNFTNGNAGTSTTALRQPWNTSLAPDGKLLIADDMNNRVLVYNTIPTTNGAAANVVIGQSNFANNGAGNTGNRLNGPGVTVSPSGVVAIADFLNHRALIFNEIPTVNNASADIVLGQRNFTETVSFNDGAGASGTATDRNMSQPYGINFDLNERLYLNGRNMHRMMVFGETPNQTADLSLAFESDNGTPCVNGLVSYTVNVTNNGPNDGTNVIVTSALPFGFTPVESEVSSGTYNQASGFWTIPLISNGETVSLEMRGTVEIGQNLNSITAYASVRSYNQVDSDFSNNSGSVTVAVEDNTAPTLTQIADVITDLNTSTAAIPFTVADTETTAGLLTVSASSSNTSIIPTANIVINGTGGNRNVTITPANNQFGTVTITLTVQDGICSSSESFDVFVGNVWLGHSTDWSLASNWSASIPSSTFSALIPTSPIGGNYPVINSDVPAYNLEINAGARITVNATRTLNVYGNCYNDGTLSTGNGIINMRGTDVQNLRGIIGGLSINNTNGVIMNGNTNIQGILNLVSGTLSVEDNTLTIRNPIAGSTANLLTNSTSSISIEGSAAGMILPTQATHLNSLRLNNGNGLTLSNDLILEGALNLTTGTLTMNTNSLTLNGHINSTNGTLSGDIDASLTINGAGNAGVLAISTTNNYVNNFEFNRNNGRITIENDLKIAGNLILTNGVVKTDNGIIWVENTDPDAISSFGEDAFINGKLRRCVIADQSYNFPVGSPNHLENAWIHFSAISEATCIDAEFNAGHRGNAPNGLNVGPNQVNDVLNYGFWTIKPTSPSVVVTYDISITSRGHTNGNIFTNHILLKRDSELNDWSILGDHMALNEVGSFNNPITVSRANLSGFSDFSVGVSSDGPLPISLVYFKGEIINDAAELTWQTASEINNDYFELEKSKDGENFDIIGIIEGQGTKYEPTNYRFFDTGENSGTTYYRFRQIDYDGKYSYSPVVVIQFKEKAGNISLFPNPVKNTLNIVFEEGNISKAQIQLFDNMGRMVINQAHTVENNRLSVDVSGLSAGSYQLKVESPSATGSIVSYTKLIKQ